MYFTNHAMPHLAERRYRWLFWTLALVGFAVDQTTKYGIFAWLYNDGRGDDFVVVPETFNLIARYRPELIPDDVPLRPLRTISGEHWPFVNHGALFGIGSLILGDGDLDFTPPPDLVGMNPAVWLSDLAAWASTLGKPLFVGLIVLAASLSMLSYLAVRWGWRLWLIRQWRQRQRGPR